MEGLESGLPLAESSWVAVPSQGGVSVTLRRVGDSSVQNGHLAMWLRECLLMLTATRRWGGGVIVAPILQMRKLRPREQKSPA